MVARGPQHAEGVAAPACVGGVCGCGVCMVVGTPPRIPLPPTKPIYSRVLKASYLLDTTWSTACSTAPAARRAPTSASGRRTNALPLALVPSPPPSAAAAAAAADGGGRKGVVRGKGMGPVGEVELWEVMSSLSHCKYSGACACVCGFKVCVHVFVWLVAVGWW